jgi:hypothetical protein
MTKPERAHRAREIIQQSGADTAEHLQQVQAVNLGTTFRQQSEFWLRHVQERKRKPIKPHTATSWKSYLRWINPRLGDVPLSSVNNLAMRGIVSEMVEQGYSPKTILNYTAVIKAVVASAIGDDGEEIYPRKWNHEFIDMPEVTSQRTPSFTSAEIEQIVAMANGQYSVSMHCWLPQDCESAKHWPWRSSISPTARSASLRESGMGKFRVPKL